MSFLASVGVTNVDLMYVGMPRVPQEGEEIFSQDFRVLLGGGAPVSYTHLRAHET